MIVYVLSPIDLVPESLPVIGLIDDAIMIPLGVGLAMRLIPREIMAEHRTMALRRFPAGRMRFWRGCLIVAGIWLLLTALVVFIAVELLRRARS